MILLVLKLNKLLPNRIFFPNRKFLYNIGVSKSIIPVREAEISSPTSLRIIGLFLTHFQVRFLRNLDSEIINFFFK